jgi:hypothetical protein
VIVLLLDAGAMYVDFNPFHVDRLTLSYQLYSSHSVIEYENILHMLTDTVPEYLSSQASTCKRSILLSNLEMVGIRLIWVVPVHVTIDQTDFPYSIHSINIIICIFEPLVMNCGDIHLLEYYMTDDPFRLLILP